MNPRMGQIYRTKTKKGGGPCFRRFGRRFQRLAVGVAMSTLFVIPQTLRAEGLLTLKKNNEGADFLKEDRAYEAHQRLLEAIEKSPKSPTVRMNLGLSFEKGGDLEKALQEYHSVAKDAEDPELRFYAHFNSGRILGEQKKIEEALKDYQAALDLKPDSQETKHNIEILMAQSQGGGGGKNDKDDPKKKQQDGEGQDKKEAEQPQNPQQYEQPKPQPKPFKSQELSAQDAKKILDELKRQEEQIRGKLTKQKPNEKDQDKDW